MRRYEFYVRVARTSEILFLPREHKVHIFELTCNVLFIFINILMTAFLMIFRGFPTTPRRFRKIFQTCSEDQTNVLLRVRCFKVVGSLLSNQNTGMSETQPEYLFHTNVVIPHNTSHKLNKACKYT